MSAITVQETIYQSGGYQVILDLLPQWSTRPPAMHSDDRSGSTCTEILDLAALRRSKQRRSLLARVGGGLTRHETAALLDESEDEVDRLRLANRLLAVPNPDGRGWLYPARQFSDGRVVPHLDEVIAKFAVKSPWTQLYVLMSGDPALGGRCPIEALRDGDREVVLPLVSGYGQQGDA